MTRSSVQGTAQSCAVGGGGKRIAHTACSDPAQGHRAEPSTLKELLVADPFEQALLNVGPAELPLLGILGYLAVVLLVVAGLAFRLSVSTDAPLGAVGGAVLLWILSNILDQITALGALRNLLPTHHRSGWLGLLSTPAQFDDVVSGAISAVLYATLRRGAHEHRSFTFLGYTFRSRRVRTRTGAHFFSVNPAVSDEAAKRIRRQVRSWWLHRRSGSTLGDLARQINPIVRGWINYYGRRRLSVAG